MFNISADNDVVTLINVFTVADPEKQRELVHLLDAATEVMKSLPGFVSSGTHRSLDGRHVANYDQWRSEADYRAMLDNPSAGEHLEAASAIASAQPVLYEVLRTTFEPNPSPPSKP